MQGNKNSIYKDDVTDTLHQFQDVEGKYVFSIQEPRFDVTKNLNNYKVYFRPRNKNTIEGFSIFSNFEGIKIYLPQWIQNVENLHSITEEYFNPENKFYDEEFTDFFGFLSIN